ICRRLIFPRIAPLGEGTNDGDWGMANCCFIPGRLTQSTAIVSSTQPAQSELRGRKVVYACFQIDKISAHNVDLDFVECSGAGCGAKINIAARILPMPSDPSG